MDKVLDVIFFQRNWSADGWKYELYKNLEVSLNLFYVEIKDELEKFSITLRFIEEELTSDIKGYGELLNSIRICCPSAGVGSYCLGHIIGASKNLDIIEDLRRGINRVAFAPETVEPAGSDKVVCHDCGCGC